jgi:hypothetical protein
MADRNGQRPEAAIDLLETVDRPAEPLGTLTDWLHKVREL